MMNAKMMEKVNNLRNMLGNKGVSYHELKRITFKNDSVPSIATLRKYGLLKVVRTETYESTMSAEEWENNYMDCDYSASDWNWNEDRGVFVHSEVAQFYGIE